MTAEVQLYGDDVERGDADDDPLSRYAPRLLRSWRAPKPAGLRSLLPAAFGLHSIAASTTSSANRWASSRAQSHG
jgi:hypothetical protein